MCSNATLVWTWVDNLQPINSVPFSFALAVFAFFAALLMVSNVRYYNPKNVKGQVPFRYMFLVILMFVSILIYPPGMLLVIGTAYALSGPILALGRRLFRTDSE